MIANTLATVRPAVVRSVRTGLAKHVPVSVARPLTVGVRAYKDDAHKKHTPSTEQQHDKQVTKSDAAAAPVAPRSMHPVMRLPSLFHEMQREMDAMSRMFGLPMGSMFEEDPFFSRPMPSLLSKMEMPKLPDMPTMRVAVDVEEDDKAYTIKADTPGIPKDALKLSVLDGTLTISGERREEKRIGGEQPVDQEKQEGAGDKEGAEAAPRAPAPLRYERSYGSFSRSFTLPPNVDVEGIKAEAQDGVLTVTIPKLPVAKPQPKEIEIN